MRLSFRRSAALLLFLAVAGFIAFRALQPAAVGTASPAPSASSVSSATPLAALRASPLADEQSPAVSASTTSASTSAPASPGLPHWIDARVLRSARTDPLPDGTYRRVTLLQPSDLPYRIRVEDVINRAPDGSETLLHRTEVVADHVLVHLASAADRAALETFLADHAASLGRPVGRRGLHRVQLADPADLDALPALLDALASAPGLRYSEPDYIVRVATTPNDPRYLDGSLWGLHNTGQDSGTPDADIDAPEGWAIRNQAPNVVVGVIDTGIRLTHEDLAPNLWVNPGETANGADTDGNGFIDDLHGINAIAMNGNPDDDQGHGSHCAGTIGARGNNGVGVTGVAWNVRLMGLKFLSASGGGTTSDAITCIEYGVDHGAHILSNSWGGGAFSQALLDSVRAARDAGVLFVVAAGNSASNNDTAPVYPASLPVDNIVAVASTTRTDALSEFSCFGQGSVDLAAPGSAILSTGHENDTAYVTLSGTSMATPHVAGALALLRAQFPSDSWSQLIHRLYRGTDTIPALANGVVGTGGRLNLHGALSTTTNRPANDDFANGRVVHGDSSVLRVLVRDATSQPGEPAIHGQAASNTVWFRFTPQASGLASVERLLGETFVNPMNGQPTTLTYNTIPTVLGVFTGSALGSLTSVASGADTASFTATAGVTYHIAVAGQSGAQGLVMLGITGAPANSTLANATTLTTNIGRTGTNRNALAEPGEPAHAGQAAQASVWYRWTAGFTGRVAFSTKGSGIDTVAAVYSGPAASPTFASLVPVAANDNAVPLSPNVPATFSRVEFQALAGATYYIAVDGKSGATGSLSATLGTPPANDDFANAFILSGASVTRSISTSFGSREVGEPVHFHNNGQGETVWCVWTAPQTGRTTLDLSGSFFRGIIAVYTGNAVNALTLVARDGAENRFAQVTFDAVQGTTYRIAVDAWDFALNNAPLRLQMVPTPPNDNFANATVLEGARITATGSNVGGTRESGEPAAGSNGGPSVWYRWTAPASGPYALYGERLNKAEDRWAIVLNVFTGSSVNGLTRLTEDLMNGIGRDAFARFNAVAGATYHFQVTGVSANGIVGGVGPFRLDLRPRAEFAPENDDFADALALDGSPVFNFRTQNYGSRAEPGEPGHGGYPAVYSLWWRFAPGAGQGGDYAIATSLSEGSIGTVVYRADNPAAPSLGALTQVASNVEFANQNFPDLRFTAQEGQVYYIAVDNFGGALGRLIFNFQKVPANVTFAGATVLPPEGASLVTYNHGAVRESGEPTGGFSPATAGNRSLWFRWTAPASGLYAVDTIGSRLPVYEDAPIAEQFGNPPLLGLDTVLGVYTGSAVNALSTVATNSRIATYSGSNWSFQRNSRLEFNATAGATYHTSWSTPTPSAPTTPSATRTPTRARCASASSPSPRPPTTPSPTPPKSPAPTTAPSSPPSAPPNKPASSTTAASTADAASGGSGPPPSPAPSSSPPPATSTTTSTPAAPASAFTPAPPSTPSPPSPPTKTAPAPTPATSPGPPSSSTPSPAPPITSAPTPSSPATSPSSSPAPPPTTTSPTPPSCRAPAGPPKATTSWPPSRPASPRSKPTSIRPPRATPTSAPSGGAGPPPSPAPSPSTPWAARPGTCSAFTPAPRSAPSRPSSPRPSPATGSTAKAPTAPAPAPSASPSTPPPAPPTISPSRAPASPWPPPAP
jgi:subtilisin family serine protease